jgi:hypothetical protein
MIIRFFIRLFYIVHRVEYGNNAVHIKKAKNEPV